MKSRIRHFRAQRTCLLSELILSHVNLSEPFFSFLLEMGAIYVNDIRCFENKHLNIGDLVRVHFSPKRFDVKSFFPLKNIVHSNPDFYIMNKPSGIPCGPSLDNYSENLLVQTSLALDEKLWLPHRLDVGTSGLICLARTKEFATWFSEQLEKHKINKSYIAVTEGIKPRLGIWKHWMRKSPRSPKILSRTPVEKWMECELNVLKVQEIQPRTYLTTIKLLTGRTHQIRAQLAFEGSPILGDTLYAFQGLRNEDTSVALDNQHFSLACNELAFRFSGEEFNFKFEPDWLHDKQSLLPEDHCF